MVIPDTESLHHRSRKAKPRATVEGLVTLRLAAASVDLFLLWPVVLLSTSGWRRAWTEAVLQNSPRPSVLSFVWISLVTTILWQFGFSLLTGASIGQKMFGFRLADAWSKAAPTPVQVGLRTLGWTISLFCFGFGFWGTLTNHRRRPFYDRWADTELISTESAANGVGAPTARERWFGRFGQYISLSLTWLFLIGVSLRTGKLQDSAEMATSPPARRCADVDRQIAEWPNQISRVDVALTLHAIGEIGEACLAEEAELALWFDRGGIESHLALAVAGFERGTQGAYRHAEIVCKKSPDSRACRLASKLRDADGEPPELLGAVPSDPAWFRAWDLKIARSRGDQRASLALSKLPSDHPRVAAYQLLARVESLIEERRDFEAQTEFQAAKPFLNFTDLVAGLRVTCGSWLAEQDCASLTVNKNCRELTQVVAESPQVLADPETLWPWLRAKSCNTGISKSTMDLALKHTADMEARDLLHILRDFQSGEKSKALKHLRTLAAIAHSEGKVWPEANRRLAEVSGESIDWERSIRRWKSSTAGNLELQWGRALARMAIAPAFKPKAREIARLLRDISVLADAVENDDDASRSPASLRPTSVNSDEDMEAP